MIKVAVFLANGFEDVEAIAPIDVMRRAGFEVTTVSVEDEMVKSSHGVFIKADITTDKMTDEYDIYFCPGGMPGALNLSQSWPVNEAIVNAYNRGAIISAICASPAVVLSPLGILKGHEATCYPGCESYAPDFEFSLEKGVVVSGNVYTAKSAGYAIDLGLELIKAFSEEKSTKIKKEIYYKEC